MYDKAVLHVTACNLVSIICNRIDDFIINRKIEEEKKTLERTCLEDSVYYHLTSHTIKSKVS